MGKETFLLDDTEEMIFLVSNEMIILYANKASVDKYGYDVENLTAMKITDLMTDDVVEELAGKIKNIQYSDTIYETVHKTKDDRLFPVEVSLKKLKNDNTFLIEVRDISKRTEVQGIFAKISGQLLSENDYSINVDSVLEIIGEFSGVDRVGIYMYKDDNKYIDNVRNWFSEATISKKYSFKNTYSSNCFQGIDQVLKINDITKNEKYKYIPSIEQSESILVLPIEIGKHIEGFVEFDSLQKREMWQKEEIAFLQICCELLALSYVGNRAENGLLKSNIELKETLETLKNTQSQLIQNEKMASIGYLASGVAHEINNPLGFVSSNFETLKKYVNSLKKIIEQYKDLYQNFNMEIYKKLVDHINDIDESENLTFIFEDLEDLYDDTNQGIKRISAIVKGLRNFSHKANQEDFEQYDLNSGIKDTLIISKNEIKYSAEISENLQNIPIIQAIPGHINQVILNIIINATQAIKSKGQSELGEIKITTRADEEYVYCIIEDSGIGIAKENLSKIFAPFFTTKPVGMGTGLGLSISYDIIKNKHHGEIIVNSEVGKGTSFTIKLPIKNS